MRLLSRRAAFATLAGVACQTPSLLRAASAGNRTLVCIRLAEPADSAGMAPSGGGLAMRAFLSGREFQLHSALEGARPLFEQRSMAVITEPGAPVEWGYLPGGFASPSWMMRAAGVSTLDTAGRAYGFATGLLLLTPVRREFGGGQFDNPALLAAAAQGDFTFPKTGIGRQLRQVAGLLAAPQVAQPMFVASIGGPAGRGNAAGQMAVRLSRLSEALTAFQSAVTRLGLESNVAAFTDCDFPGLEAERTRLLVGGSVLGGETYSATPRQIAQQLSAWVGLAETAPSNAARFLY